MHLCKKLIDNKFEILALIRNTKLKEYKELLSMGVEIIETGDLFQRKFLNIDLTGVKYLINLATLAHVNRKRFIKNYKNYVFITSNEVLILLFFLLLQLILGYLMVCLVFC